MDHVSPIERPRPREGTTRTYAPTCSLINLYSLLFHLWVRYEAFDMEHSEFL